MTSPRLDRRTLSKATGAGLLRLAKFNGVHVPDDCICDKCRTRLVEVLVRKLDVEESWPPKLYERNW